VAIDPMQAVSISLLVKQLPTESRPPLAVVGKSVFTFSDALTYSLMSTDITHLLLQVHKGPPVHKEQPDHKEQPVTAEEQPDHKGPRVMPVHEEQPDHKGPRVMPVHEEQPDHKGPQVHKEQPDHKGPRVMGEAAPTFTGKTLARCTWTHTVMTIGTSIAPPTQWR
jgi:hypothetical protein